MLYLDLLLLLCEGLDFKMFSHNKFCNCQARISQIEWFNCITPNVFVASKIEILGFIRGHKEKEAYSLKPFPKAFQGV